ncbi:TonB-dependent siderophore receptor [Pseudomonas sp. Marseille-Q1929]|uniref:TonB-dependent siderophore receptor n=1 Tax=Pseudomonas sp. Marseille-Q1929 TaxID=2730402 RepID=UPI001F5D245C|nr:TonB-dependent siderophore receptor [Pseudomonas sp. Marseille-Q1929]
MRQPQRYVLPFHSLALAIRGATLGLLVAGSVVTSPPLLAEPIGQQHVRHYTIPAGALSTALAEFASQAGITLPIDPALVEGKRSAGLNANTGIDEGLRSLLRGSGLNAVASGDGSYTLYPLGDGSSIELGATSITGQQLGQTTENSGSYTTGSTSTATKLPMSLRETPQSVTVITRQHMNDQGLGSIAEVLGQTPGVTVMHDDSERYNFYSRGFALDSFQYDGVPTSDFTTNTNGLGVRDMAIYDRVEVVRGATGLMSGVGSPAGVVNLVRKRPTKDFQGYVSGSGGTWDRYRTEMDLSGPLSENGALRGRVVAAHQDNHSFIDYYAQKKDVFYAIGEADITPDTTLYAGIDYQKIDADGSSFGQLPLYNADGNRANFKRSTNPAAKWTYADSQSTKYFAGIEQRFDNDWLLRVEASHWKGTTDQLQGNIVGWGPFPDETTHIAELQRSRVTYTINADSVDAYATGPFSLLGRTHELVVGLNASNRRSDYQSLDGGSLNVNYETWGNNPPQPEAFTFQQSQGYKIKESGGYAALRLNPLDDWHVILGSRVVNYEREGTLTYGWKPNDPSDDSAKKTGKLVPYAGIVYDLNDIHSLYVSYTDIFTPQSLFDKNDKALEPLTGQSYEAGLKSEFFDGALNTSFAVFTIKQDNLGVDDGVRTGGLTAYKAVSGTTTKGFEMQLSGQLTPGWQMLAGFTYAQPRDKDGNRINTNLPERQFKLSTAYKLEGALRDLTVGGNVTWQSSTYSAITYPMDARADEGSFAVVGLMARYDVSKNLSASLNLNNLFDREYYAGYGLYSSAFYGDPRNMTVGLKYQF